MSSAEAVSIVFTKHALKKLRQRKIGRRLVIKTILKPEKLIFDGTQYNVYKKFGRLYLKVVFKKLGKLILVITQHWTDKTQ